MDELVAWRARARETIDRWMMHHACRSTQHDTSAVGAAELGEQRGDELVAALLALLCARAQGVLALPPAAHEREALLAQRDHGGAPLLLARPALGLARLGGLRPALLHLGLPAHELPQHGLHLALPRRGPSGGGARLLPPALLRAGPAARVRRSRQAPAGLLVARRGLFVLVLFVVVNIGGVVPLAGAFVVQRRRRRRADALALGPLPLQCLRALGPGVEYPPHLVVERELRPRLLLLRGGRVGRGGGGGGLGALEPGDEVLPLGLALVRGAREALRVEARGDGLPERLVALGGEEGVIEVGAHGEEGGRLGVGPLREALPLEARAGGGGDGGQLRGRGRQGKVRRRRGEERVVGIGEGAVEVVEGIHGGGARWGWLDLDAGGGRRRTAAKVERRDDVIEAKGGVRAVRSVVGIGMEMEVKSRRGEERQPGWPWPCRTRDQDQ
uniref:Uncharacterized protein n=1 Tax=Zea mays TaxID=4577 RepID=A0A804PSM5_MAIZE